MKTMKAMGMKNIVKISEGKLVFGATSQPFAWSRALAGNGEDLVSFPQEKTYGNKNQFPSVIHI